MLNVPKYEPSHYHAFLSFALMKSIEHVDIEFNFNKQNASEK
jgi:hypothetical protein